MGLALTVFYFLYGYVSPASWVPWLTTISVQPFVAGLACLSTLPRFLTRSPFKVSPQLLLFGTFCAFLIVSPALHGWFGGVFESFIPVVIPALLLFMVPLNTDSVARRKVVAVALLCSMLGLAVAGIREYRMNPEQSKFVMVQGIEEDEDASQSDEAPGLYRLKAQGLIDDPNDFAQMLLIAISLSFLWWSRNWVTNILFVLIPGAILLYAVYLTHSRGALVAMGAMIAVGFRRKLKLAGSLTMAGLAAAGLLASSFTGGREVNIAGGTDRLELWSEGLAMFKSSPLIGHGFGSFYDEVNAAAHNAVVVVAADLGILGLVIWAAVFVISFTQLNRIIKPEDGTPPDPVLRQHALCLETALASFLATSWFLSRAYYPISFLLVGMVAGLAYQESLRRPGADLAPPWKKWLVHSTVIAVAALATIYVMVRLRVA